MSYIPRWSHWTPMIVVIRDAGSLVRAHWGHCFLEKLRHVDNLIMSISMVSLFDGWHYVLPFQSSTPSAFSKIASLPVGHLLGLAKHSNLNVLLLIQSQTADLSSKSDRASAETLRRAWATGPRTSVRTLTLHQLPKYEIGITTIKWI
jgi:hypothetical protein